MWMAAQPATTVTAPCVRARRTCRGREWSAGAYCRVSSHVLTTAGSTGLLRAAEEPTAFTTDNCAPSTRPTSMLIPAAGPSFAGSSACSLLPSQKPEAPPPEHVVDLASQRRLAGLARRLDPLQPNSATLNGRRHVRTDTYVWVQPVRGRSSRRPSLAGDARWRSECCRPRRTRQPT
jgi:hypothetical protein